MYYWLLGAAKHIAHRADSWFWQIDDGLWGFCSFKGNAVRRIHGGDFPCERLIFSHHLQMVTYREGIAHFHRNRILFLVNCRNDTDKIILLNIRGRSLILSLFCGIPEEKSRRKRTMTCFLQLLKTSIYHFCLPSTVLYCI